MTRLVLVGLLFTALTGCATQPLAPRQVKAESDFADCARDVNARGATLSFLSAEGQFKMQYGSYADRTAMLACMRAKGHRFFDGPTAF